MKKQILGFLLAALVTAAAVVACGSDSSPGAALGSGTVNGNMGGSPYTVADAAFGSGPFLGPSFIVTAIAFADITGTCDPSWANAREKSSRSLAFILADTTGAANTSTAVSAPGTYAVYKFSDPNYPSHAKTAFGSFSKYDATCNDSGAEFITGGNVTITAVSASNVTGTFDLTTTAGEHLTGSFSAGNCNLLLTAASDGGRTCR